MNTIHGYLMALVVCLVALAAVAPAIVALANALLPLVIVPTVAIAALRVIFFHTRRW